VTERGGQKGSERKIETEWGGTEGGERQRGEKQSVGRMMDA